MFIVSQTEAIVSVCLQLHHLEGGARVGEQVNFAEVVRQSDHLPVVRPHQSVDVGAV